MKKYRKKPVVIEAEQWFGYGDVPEANIIKYSDQQMYKFNPTDRCDRCGELYINHGFLHTLEGFQIVCPGDYIVKGVEGEFYPCKADIFEKTYEEVN